MQKDVLIFLVSSQSGDFSGDDKIEIITAGQYFYKNNKHYLIYEEIPDDGGPAVKNTIKIYDGKAEVMKSGDASVHMVFEQHKKTFSYYDIPYGKMLAGIETKHLEFNEEENRIFLRLEYSLEIDYQHLSDCIVEIRAESRETCKIDLGR